MIKGLTYIEILLVVALASLIAAGGIGGLSQLQTVFKLRGAADEIRAQLQLGRELAIANKDQLAYQISLTSGIVILRSEAGEIARYMSPSGITYTPGEFSWNLTPLTGVPVGCVLPCELSLTSSGNTELVIFQENGIVN